MEMKGVKPAADENPDDTSGLEGHTKSHVGQRAPTFGNGVVLHLVKLLEEGERDENPTADNGVSKSGYGFG
jgi:hypothetical protein